MQISFVAIFIRKFIWRYHRIWNIKNGCNFQDISNCFLTGHDHVRSFLLKFLHCILFMLQIPTLLQWSLTIIQNTVLVRTEEMNSVFMTVNTFSSYFLLPQEMPRDRVNCGTIVFFVFGARVCFYLAGYPVAERWSTFSTKLSIIQLC